MNRFLGWLAIAGICMMSGSANAGVSYGVPPSGWAYLFDGTDTADAANAALDGTWNHENGSDAWDGSGIRRPGTAPGGISLIQENTTNLIRMQDTGDPRTLGFSDPSNRKIYLTHDIGQADPSGNLIEAGVTLTFRARLASFGLLDGSVPRDGDGYNISDSGKGNFSIRSPNVAGGQGGLISFSLATAGVDDLAQNPSGALLMNSFDPTSGTAVDSGSAGEHREFPLEDPTDWNEFWITIEGGQSANTYDVNVYANGDTNGTSFVVSGGSGSDGSFASYLGLGLPSTPQSGALDVDFFGFKPGIHAPQLPPPSGDFNGNGQLDAGDIDLLHAEIRAGTNDLAFDVTGDGSVDQNDRNFWVVDLANTYFGDANFDGEFNSSDLVDVLRVGEYEDGIDNNSNWAEGDWDGNGDFDSGDFLIAFQFGGYEQGPRAAVASVPEPSSGLLLLSGCAVLRRRRRRER